MWRGKARHGQAWHGTARQGKARQGKARQGRARHGGGIPALIARVGAGGQGRTWQGMDLTHTRSETHEEGETIAGIRAA